MQWFFDNVEWLFSGIGVFLVSTFMVMTKLNGKGDGGEDNKSDVSHLVYEGAVGKAQPKDRGKFEGCESLEDFKNRTKILFVDDDARFKVVKILTRSGWVHTKLIKDCDTLDDLDVVEADILFIDVQGVGVSMGFSDEGLGLALAIKEKYKEKKVIIYSAETEGDRFHEALRKADTFLAKNADPYQFQRLVEEYTIGSAGE